jgi:DNA-binding MarR family transcriptional regulator
MYLEHAQNMDVADIWLKDGASAQAVALQLRELAARLDDEASRRVALTCQRPGLTNDMPSQRCDYLLKVRAILQERKARKQVFGASYVDDPAWAIMLDLFEAYLTQQTRSVKSVAIASGVPSTTAFRHLAQLEAEGLLEKRSDVCDKRRILVQMTDEGRRKMFKYFENIAKTL